MGDTGNSRCVDRGIGENWVGTTYKDVTAEKCTENCGSTWGKRMIELKGWGTYYSESLKRRGSVEIR